ncbi:MAG: hypothetical protein ABIP79_17980 [Chitinophagaceae bacterium]
MKIFPFKIKTFFILLGLQMLTVYCNAQNIEAGREDELAIGIKIVSGNIIFGPNKYYITEPNSVYVQPGIRYDYPIKLYPNRTGRKDASVAMQAGFLFCKAKDFDSLYFNPKNPTYFTLSAGLYNLSTLSVGAELFFWKGLGKRDIWGAKFLSLGYNGKNIRINAAGEYYAQIINSQNNGIIFSIDFLIKLIRG